MCAVFYRYMFFRFLPRDLTPPYWINRGPVAICTLAGVLLADAFATCFTAGVNQELGSALLDSPAWLVGPALGVIGLGTLLWLVGSFVYLSGAMDSDPSGPDLYF